jgi:NAD(P)-dependent dehydrogenase (short-subunit alcohol dehydrogenase family)
VADAADEEALDRFYDAVGDNFPRLDIVVNVAGGTRRQPLVQASRSDIAQDIQRNYGYVVQSVQRAIGLLERSGDGGSIVNFTSIEAHRGAATFSVYAGAKAATTNFTRCMAVELGKQRIRVNCIAPDTTPSRGNGAAMPPELGESFARLPSQVQPRGMQMYIPRGEQPSPEALSDAVLFLASDLSTFVSGMTLHVDGGTMAAAGFLDWPFGDGFVPVPLTGTLGRMFGEADDR